MRRATLDSFAPCNGYRVATTYVRVTFGHGAWNRFPALVQRRGAPFWHYRLGRSQAYLIELAIVDRELTQWLPRFTSGAIARIECATGEWSEHVTVDKTVVAPDRRAARIVLDALVLLNDRRGVE